MGLDGSRQREEHVWRPANRKKYRCEGVQGGMEAVRRVMRSQDRKMSRDQVAEGPRSHVRIASFFLRPMGDNW